MGRPDLVLRKHGCAARGLPSTDSPSPTLATRIPELKGSAIVANTHNSEKPQTIQGDLRNLPRAITALTKLPHWVLWRWEKPKDKWTKVPYQPSGAKAK